MATDQLTLPLSDEDLITLAAHRYAQADRDGATTEDYLQLVDIFPAVLQRLRDQVHANRRTVSIQMIDLGQGGSFERLAAAGKKA